MREKTGLPLKPIIAHPYRHKKSGPDGKDEQFGPARIVRRLREPIEKPTPVPKERRAPKAGDVEVYLGFDGIWKATRVPCFANQFELERLTSQEIETQLALRECPEPTHHRNYLFKAMACADRDEAVWVRCIHRDAVREEEVLAGREVTNKDLCASIEYRWQMRLSVKRPLIADQDAIFKWRTEDEEYAEIDAPVQDTKVIPQRPPRATTAVVGQNQIATYEGDGGTLTGQYHPSSWAVPPQVIPLTGDIRRRWWNPGGPSRVNVYLSNIRRSGRSSACGH
jgi:hypothetical protein